MRNRYKKSYICIAFALVSALSALAQSGRTDVQRWDGLQPKANDPGEPLLAALVEAPALAVSSDSDLPDAPSTTKADASAADPAPSPAVKRESTHGAPPTAMGGPLWVGSHCRGPELPIGHRRHVRLKYCKHRTNLALLE